MVRNIPNKYTQGMLLELFEKNHKKKFDFFYLPIDYNVPFPLSRITAMSVMRFWISFTPNLSSIFTDNFTEGSGIGLILLKFVKSGMPEFKERLSCSTTSSTQTFFSKKINVSVLLLGSNPWLTFRNWSKNKKTNTLAGRTVRKAEMILFSN